MHPLLLASIFGLLCSPVIMAITLHVGRTLTARFDSQAMLPLPQPSEAPAPEQAATLGTLLAWAQSGMGSGRAHWWWPGAQPQVDQALSQAVLRGAGAAQLAQWAALELDRNAELEALQARSRWAGLQLKLAVKWHELWWWRARHARQPWDCGLLVDDAAALAAFRPRRPTLLVAEGLGAEALARAAQTLGAASASYRHPVRLLVLMPGPQRVALVPGAA